MVNKIHVITYGNGVFHKSYNNKEDADEEADKLRHSIKNEGLSRTGVKVTETEVNGFNLSYPPKEATDEEESELLRQIEKYPEEVYLSIMDNTHLMRFSNTGDSMAAVMSTGEHFRMVLDILEGITNIGYTFYQP